MPARDAPYIDPSAFPHIYEAIVAGADHRTRLALRRVSRAVRAYADHLPAELALELSTFWVFPPAAAPEEVHGVWLGGAREPQLSPFTPPAVRADLMGRAARVTVQRCPFSAHFQALLARVPPRCALVFEYACDAGEAPYALPPAARLEIRWALPLDERHVRARRNAPLTLPLRHQAPEVRLHICELSRDFSGGSPPEVSLEAIRACQLYPGTVNRGVRRLTVSGLVRALPFILEQEIERSPELLVEMEHCPDCFPAHPRAFAHVCAALFNIPVTQVTMTPVPLGSHRHEPTEPFID